LVSGAAAARTWHVELHAPAGLCDLPFAVALGAGCGALDVSAAAAVRTQILAADVDAQLRSPDRLPETHTDLVFEIASRLWTGADARLGGRGPAPEDAAENIAEAPGAGAAASARACSWATGKVGKIEAAEIKRDLLGSARRPARAGAGSV